MSEGKDRTRRGTPGFYNPWPSRGEREQQAASERIARQRAAAASAAADRAQTQAFVLAKLPALDETAARVAKIIRSRDTDSDFKAAEVNSLAIDIARRLAEAITEGMNNRSKKISIQHNIQPAFPYHTPIQTKASIIAEIVETFSQ